MVDYLPRSMYNYKQLNIQPMTEHEDKYFDLVLDGFVLSQNSWNEQEALCESRGAHLWSINSKTELDDVLQLLYEGSIKINYNRTLPFASIIFIALEKVSEFCLSYVK